MAQAPVKPTARAVQAPQQVPDRALLPAARSAAPLAGEAAPAAASAQPAAAEIVPVEYFSPWRGSAKVTRVTLPTPKIGGKGWLLNRKGIFVLEEGYGVLRTIACTHIGSGSMIVHNGLPDANGEFPERPQFVLGQEGEYNGRPLFRANPVVMGSWMMDAGFTYGLTIQAEGGMDNNCAIATIVWLPAPPPRVAAGG